MQENVQLSPVLTVHMLRTTPKRGDWEDCAIWPRRAANLQEPMLPGEVTHVPRLAAVNRWHIRGHALIARNILLQPVVEVRRAFLGKWICRVAVQQLSCKRHDLLVGALNDGLVLTGQLQESKLRIVD